MSNKKVLLALAKSLKSQDDTELQSVLKKGTRRKDEITPTDVTVLVVNHVGPVVESRFLLVNGDYRHLAGSYKTGENSQKHLELKSLLLPVTEGGKHKMYKAFPIKAFRRAKNPSVTIVNLLSSPLVYTSDDNN